MTTFDAGIGDPPLDDRADRLDVVGDDLTRRELVTGRVSRSASVEPDLSSASERVSEIVSTAILSGMNCLTRRWKTSALTATPRRRYYRPRSCPADSRS